MTPHEQLIKHDPVAGNFGDCQRTCVAAILDLDPADVPHFCDNPTVERDSEEWWARRQERWLSGRGLASATFAYSGETPFEQVMEWTSCQSPEVPMILCGTSSLGSNHVVVAMAGRVVCDPSGNGIVGPTKEGAWEVTVICVGPNWRARTEVRA